MAVRDGIIIPDPLPLDRCVRATQSFFVDMGSPREVRARGSVGVAKSNAMERRRLRWPRAMPIRIGRSRGFTSSGQRRRLSRRSQLRSDTSRT
jgi:hypothetical protein